MGDYKPGTLAIATVRGVEGVTVFRDEEDWHSAVRVKDALFHGEFVVSDIRPLVVLDFTLWTKECPGLIAEWITKLAVDDHACPSTSAARMVAQEIAEQTAPPKPPRIDEPGLWGVVNAREADSDGRFDWVHTDHGWTNHHGYTTSWSQLMDPTLVRDGIES